LFLFAFLLYPILTIVGPLGAFIVLATNLTAAFFDPAFDIATVRLKPEAIFIAFSEDALIIYLIVVETLKFFVEGFTVIHLFVAVYINPLSEALSFVGTSVFAFEKLAFFVDISPLRTLSGFTMFVTIIVVVIIVVVIIVIVVIVVVVIIIEGSIPVVIVGFDTVGIHGAFHDIQAGNDILVAISADFEVALIISRVSTGLLIADFFARITSRFIVVFIFFLI